MKKFLAVLFLLALTGPAQAEPIAPAQLEYVTRALNLACGDSWCSGGDYQFDFLGAEFFEKASRLTLVIRVRSIPDKWPTVDRTMKCMIYNFNSFKELIKRGMVTDSLQTEVTNCTDTLEANL